MYIASTKMLQRHTLASFFCTLLLLCKLLISADAEAAGTASQYSIVVSSAPGTNLKWVPKKHSLFEEYTFYVEKTTVKGKPWERLCLGFFSPRSDAVAILKQVQLMYPGAWIQKVSTKNILKTIYSPTGPITGNSQSASQKKNVNQATGNPSSLTEKQLDSLMQRAKTDFKKKKYSSSIRYLNALVAADNHKYSQEALELLGVTRQRNGQKAVSYTHLRAHETNDLISYAVFCL